MALYIDQLGRTVNISSPPKKIISLVPSQTELLFDLGLDNAVIGITKFCTHPGTWFRTKQRVGGTKNVNHETIAKLNPDLIVGNKEENSKEDIEALSKQYPVWLSDISTLDEAIEMIRQISSISCKNAEGAKIISSIQGAFGKLAPIKIPLKVCYLIWQNPYIAVGGNTFINTMLELCGFVNMFSDMPRYPEITFNDIAAKECDLVLLSSEPFPFKEKHQVEMQAQLNFSKIMLVDGELFSWYGSRLMKAPGYFQTLINKLQ